VFDHIQRLDQRDYRLVGLRSGRIRDDLLNIEGESHRRTKESNVKPTAQETRMIEVATRIHHSDEQSAPDTEGFTLAEIMAAVRKYHPNTLLDRSITYRSVVA
jgi:hypothetical protein